MKILDFKDDIKSSVVVFLVALPLCLGIALASNAPIASGLISGIIGGIVIGLMSGSGISVSGPAAGLTVIVVNGIATLGSFETFGLAVVIAGLFQIIFGIIRFGAVGDYFPTAVIQGMLAAIGLILIIKQFPNAFSRESIGINVISGIALGIMLIWERLPFKLVPGALVAVVVTVLLNQLFDLISPENLVQIPNAVFSNIKIPNFQSLNLSVLGVAITISIVASIETLLCIDAADTIDPLKRKTNRNRELFAQGVGNTISGLVGGLPLTAVIVRTSTNVTAGGKTKISAIFHGVWLLSLVLFVPDLLRLIPLATLACVLLLVGYKLTQPALYFKMHKRGWEQFVIFFSTIIGILATDLLIGILIGLGIAILFELRSPALSCVEILEEGNDVHIKFTKNVSFFHKAKIHKIMNDIRPEKKVHIHRHKDVRVHIDVHEIILEYQAKAQIGGRVVLIT